MSAVVTFLRRQWWVVALLIILLVGGGWLAKGATRDAKERQESRQHIEALAHQIRDQNDTLLQIARTLEAATSPEAQARSAAATAAAVAALRKSYDCGVAYILGDRPQACPDVSGRIDALRAGQDPFAAERKP